MKNLVAAALALALLGNVATTAQADERSSRTEQRTHQWDNDRNKSREVRHDHDKDRRHDHRRDDRFDSRHQDRYDHKHHDHRYDRGQYHHHKHGHYVKPHGYRYRAWRHGDQLPRAYRVNRYIVNDYKVFRLRPPPRGFHWVRVDNDVILAAIATGLVAQAIHGVF